MQANRKDFLQSPQRGEWVSLWSEDILALNWRDKHVVYVLSTIHEDTSVKIQRRHSLVQKPDCIHDYNQFIGGVDYNNQVIHPYLTTRRSCHCYKKSIYLPVPIGHLQFLHLSWVHRKTWLLSKISKGYCNNPCLPERLSTWKHSFWCIEQTA